ncbi:phage tail tape measure protein [Spartinivicinus poritis]|uniref:Phage tail tape measure protein n=1 Tax=Spartinivicinus poritis TaxID=2994640 RepID=A0ABT5UGM6_9GAMM|nr:phage tail tape measure protein [Spartinivicinus sp. A2-2]MDE1465531.1 phage tail tape measure protein [Spartinivicinus sp. A2-2]
MTSATMRLQMVMELADRLSAPMNQVTQRTERFNREVSESHQRLNELGNTRRALEQFRQLRQRTEQTSTALEEAQRETAQVAREFNRTTNPTAALTRRLQEATAQTRGLRQQHLEERQELQQLRVQLQQAGLSTTNLDHATLSLQRRTDRYNRELEEQQRQLERTQARQERLNRLQERSSDLKSKLVGDTAKLTGAVFAVKQLSDAYADVVSAKGEIGSLGITAEGQNVIAEKAREYSNQFAGTTTEAFILASYDIKSGISSLGDSAVGEFTKIAALTAGATKSSTAEMTSLFASGYAIYRDQFTGFAKGYIEDWEKLSAEEKDIKFGQMFSAGISSSVQMFKTDGPKVAQALSTLGATATSAGAAMEEQFSVLGMLSASMQGGEAATKYKRFILSAGKAGEKLGLQFLDANNKLLPTVDILRRLKEQYGDTLDDVEKQELSKAFGTSEAVDLIDMLFPKINELDDTVGKMRDNLQKGMKTTNTMANNILSGGTNEAYELLGQRFNNLAVTVGEIFAPALIAVSNLLGEAAIVVQDLIKDFPLVSKAILWGAGAFVALKVAMIAGRTAMLAWNAATLFGLTTASSLNLAMIRMGAIHTALAAKTAVVTAAQWLWNTALMANPIGLVITAVGALIGIAAYLVDDWGAVGQWFVDLWDDITALFWNGWEVIKTVFSYSPLGLLIQHWQPITGYFDSLCEAVKNIFSIAWKWIQESVIGPIMAIKETLGAAWNKLFGDDDKSVEVTQKVKQISDQAVKISNENPDITNQVKQPEPLTGNTRGMNQTNNYQIAVNVDQPNATPDEINKAVAKAMDEHQRKNARSIRGNLHD